MDLRTGRTYASVEAARADGVPESDIAHVVWPEAITKMVDGIPLHRPEPKVSFSKGSFKPVPVQK